MSLALVPLEFAAAAAADRCGVVKAMASAADSSVAGVDGAIESALLELWRGNITPWSVKVNGGLRCDALGAQPVES
jgi:hypothetical protein